LSAIIGGFTAPRAVHGSPKSKLSIRMTFQIRF
jgi:hypothetical protein